MSYCDYGSKGLHIIMIMKCSDAPRLYNDNNDLLQGTVLYQVQQGLNLSANHTNWYGIFWIKLSPPGNIQIKHIMTNVSLYDNYEMLYTLHSRAYITGMTYGYVRCQ